MTNETCMAARCNKSAMPDSTLCQEHYDALPAPMRGEQPTSKERNGPPFTVDRYGAFSSCVIAERNWLRRELAKSPHDREPPHCSTCACGVTTEPCEALTQQHAIRILQDWIQDDDQVQLIRQHWPDLFAAYVALKSCADGTAQPPSAWRYRVQTFWSPCRKYLVNVHAAPGDLSLIDDNGDIWEAAGPEQDVADLDKATPTKSARRYACAGCGKDIADCECSKFGEPDAR